MAHCRVEANDAGPLRACDEGLAGAQESHFNGDFGPMEHPALHLHLETSVIHVPNMHDCAVRHRRQQARTTRLLDHGAERAQECLRGEKGHVAHDTSVAFAPTRELVAKLRQHQQVQRGLGIVEDVAELGHHTAELTHVLLVDLEALEESLRLRRNVVLAHLQDLGEHAQVCVVAGDVAPAQLRGHIEVNEDLRNGLVLHELAACLLEAAVQVQALLQQAHIIVGLRPRRPLRDRTRRTCRTRRGAERNCKKTTEGQGHVHERQLTEKLQPGWVFPTT
mmetsp:Transcript_58729/g.136624  ORF Transcript_58729/g.136624 Transcript_58729/m.136624 type:complete len:278 (-) Transcript_58729:8-841(-)